VMNSYLIAFAGLLLLSGLSRSVPWEPGGETPPGDPTLPGTPVTATRPSIIA
jgi:hypothetical protein